MSESQELLEEYAKNGSEAAFHKPVSSYVGLVYSTAFRIVGRDQALAEDVTQTVFVDLAQKAGTLSPRVMLGGWLHRNTCFVAARLSQPLPPASRSKQRPQRSSDHQVPLD